MAELPIPAGYGVPLVDLTTFRLPEPTMEALTADAVAASATSSASAAAAALAAESASGVASTAATDAESARDAAVGVAPSMIVDAAVVDENLILTRQSGQTLDAGVVKGDKGEQGEPGDGLDTVLTSGLNAVSYGDSITNAGGYQPYVTARLQLSSYVNRGVSGRPMSDAAGGNGTVTTILANSDHAGYNIVTIAAGTNDFKLNVPIGVLGTWASALDRNTFFGAYRTALDYILNQNPLARVVLCTPLKRNNAAYTDESTNTAGHKLRDYVQAIRDVAAMYGLPVCDWYADSGFNERTLFTYTNDGLHPNAIGQARLGRFMGDYIASILGVVEFVYSDSFTAPDGTALSGRALDQGGIAWARLTGSVSIATITAGKVGWGSGTGFSWYVVNPRSADGILEVTMGATRSSPGSAISQIMFRFQDVSNYWALNPRMDPENHVYSIQPRTAGVTQIGVGLITTVTPAPGDRIKLVIAGKLVTLFVNDVNLGTADMGTTFAGKTHVGLSIHGNDTTTSFDNFSFATTV